MPRDAWLECSQAFLRFVDQLAGHSSEDPTSEAAPCQELQVGHRCLLVLGPWSRILSKYLVK